MTSTDQFYCSNLTISCDNIRRDDVAKFKISVMHQITRCSIRRKKKTPILDRVNNKLLLVYTLSFMYTRSEGWRKFMAWQHVHIGVNNGADIPNATNGKVLFLNHARGYAYCVFYIQSVLA